MPRGYRTEYQPLVDYLAAQTGQEVTLSFAEIEAIIGRPLSISATINAGHWHAAKTEARVRRWQEIGWLARYDRRNLRVVFTRDGVGDG